MTSLWERSLNWVDGRKSLSGTSLPVCPYCLGEVDARATVCRHCAREMSPTSSAQLEPDPQPGTPTDSNEQPAKVRIFGAVLWAILAYGLSPVGSPPALYYYLALGAVGLAIWAKAARDPKKARIAFWMACLTALSLLGQYGTMMQKASFG